MIMATTQNFRNWSPPSRRRTGKLASGKKPGQVYIKLSLFIEVISLLTESKADNVSCVRHSAMPGSPSVQLLWRSDIEEKVPKRCLESIESKVQKIEGEDREPD